MHREPVPLSASQIALPWVIRLRHAMVVGQLVTSAIAQWVLGVDLPLAWIWIPPLLVFASNVWLSRRQVDSSLIAYFFILDTFCLTAMLMLTGGPANPFSLLYLVHITLSATILTQRQTWTLGILSSLCFGLLFWFHRPIPQLEMHHQGAGFNLHLTGMWVGFTVASMLVALFSARISELLRHMQEELGRKERLASLVTLAAGAAHELNTPLGTIAIVAKELERYATTTSPDLAIAEDSRLIRTEVDRCQEILRRMSVQGAEPAGEALSVVSARDLALAATAQFPEDRVRVQTIEPAPQNVFLRIPVNAVEQALAALVKNGLEASKPDQPVRVSFASADGVVRFLVKDLGSGMSPEIIRHAGEPFFTTKEPGKGMGLGVFLVRTLAGRLGGTLTYESEPGKGATAILELPAYRQTAEPAAR